MAKVDSIASGVAHCLVICWMDVKVIWNVWTYLDETILAQIPNEPKLLYAVIGRARCFASDSPFKWP